MFENWNHQTKPVSWSFTFMGKCLHRNQVFGMRLQSPKPIRSYRFITDFPEFTRKTIPNHRGFMIFLGASIFLSTCRQSPETAAFAVSKFLRRVACAQAPRNCWIPWGTLAADACENQLGIREMCRRTGDGCWISQKQLVLVTCLLSWSKWRDPKLKKRFCGGLKSSPFSPGQ